MSINYNSYLQSICTEQDFKKYKKFFDEDIAKQQKALEEFVVKAEERLNIVKQYEDNKQFVILGSTMKDGRNKEILLIIRYPDGSQRDERYSFGSIADMRSKLAELKETYSDVDWSKFEEDIK